MSDFADYLIGLVRKHLRQNPGIHALRRLLKRLLRQHGLRCVSAHEESVPVRDSSNEIADTFAQLRDDVRRRESGGSARPPQLVRVKNTSGLAPATSNQIANTFTELRHDVRNRLRERSS
jgi:hypothetical protein